MHGNLHSPSDTFDHIELWFATSAAEEFFDPAALSPADQKRFTSHRGARRQREFKVSRALKAFSFAEREGTTFSLSHSAGLAALAIGPADVLLGVDLEVARPRDVIRIARDVFDKSEVDDLMAAEDSQRQHHFYVLWTLKEAFIKALKLNLFDGLRDCVFHRSAGGWFGSVPTELPWLARTYQPGDGFYLAFACIGREYVENSFEWPPKQAVNWPLIASVSARAGAVVPPA